MNNSYNNDSVLFILLAVLMLVWMIDTTTVVSLSQGAGNGKCVDKERHALLDFKANLKDPYNVLSTWGGEKEEEENDCCKWSGVTCNNQTGHVTELYLSSNGLEGEISHSFLNLTYLSHLYLSDNSFTGTIPRSIGSLTELTYLDLSYNSFTGTILTSIGSMTQLRSLHLSGNSFNGTIPISIGSLTELRFLGLSGNNFNGIIPMSIGSLTELRYLDLSRNNFKGIIPMSIGALTELRSLYLSVNSFTGTIPTSIGTLTELRSLDISYNSFTGTIPQELGNLTNLEKLLLYNIGSLAIENVDWVSHLSQLQSLDMSGTSLAKANNWVNAILSLQKLSDLSLTNCDLSNVMHPYSSSSVNSSSSSNIVTLHLRNNNLNSSMYDWLFPLTSNNSLHTLDLSNNKLDGIPKHIGNLSSLTTLDISSNLVAVSFSDFFHNLSAFTLQYLEASDNQIIGALSDDIQNFSSQLIYLNLSSNNITGRVTNLNPELLTIDLSSNNFYGPISDVPSNLNLLNLSRNKFYGGISFLCKIFDGVLQYLDLSHNSFSGQLPDCLWHFNHLIVLNLGNNKLTGKIPRSLESLIRLEVLYLYNNTFSGELPLSLKNCTSLKFLDLGENNFSGNLPVWIGENLSRLYALSLKSNNFFGPLPLQLCQLVHLQILDLSMNKLYGTIPSCLNNLTFMVQKGLLSTQNIHGYGYNDGGVVSFGVEYLDHAMIQWQGNMQEFTTNLRLLKSIDISSNNLTGRIPYELTDLLGLVALNLSKNSLIGEIPESVGQMKELLTLDLSRNRFSGKIPPSMSQMALLSYLDVSYNNLSGRVPTGSQLQTFEPSWFAGNARLCGPPATKHCPGDEELHVQPTVDESEDGMKVGDDLEKWFYIGGASGFAVGFWIVCSILLLNRRGRHAFFNFLDKLRDWVYVKLMVLIAKSSARA